MGGILRKFGIFILIVLFVSPVVLVFSGNNDLFIRFNDLIQRALPGFGETEEVNTEVLVLQQEEVEIEEDFRNNVFLPGRQYLLNIPQGFTARMVTNKIEDAGHMEQMPDGSVLVISRSSGSLVRLTDQEGDFIVSQEESVSLAEGALYDMDFHDGNIYAFSNTGVYRHGYENGTISQEGEQIIADLPRPSAGRALIEIGPDEKIYLFINASCLLCVEQNDRRASLWRFDLDGANGTVVASGIREMEGLTFNTATGEMVFTDKKITGPNEAASYAELNLFAEGANYGWPNCYGDNAPFDPANGGACQTTTAPLVTLEARTEPANVVYLADDAWPNHSRGKYLVALNGSNDIGTPVGFSLVLVDPAAENEEDRVQDFAIGWLLGTEFWGRPFEVIEAGSGRLLIGDSFAGAIYQLSFRP